MIRQHTNLLRTGINPAHKNTFSIAATLALTKAEVAAIQADGGTLKGGTFVKTSSATTGATIIGVPTEKISKTAAATAQGILAHDINLSVYDNDAMDVAAGVIVSGQVYEDVVTAANGGAAITADEKKALALQNILFYNAITLKK